MPYTRRNILKHGATLAAVSTMPSPLMAMLRTASGRGVGMVPGMGSDAIPAIEDPSVKRLTDAALDAARSAGAVYADVRLTHTFTNRMGDAPVEEESMTFGVRALVDGYWGFASSPLWTTDEAARLSRGAVHNAKANTLGKPRTMELAPTAPIANGHWTTPIKDDPFMISADEIADFFGAIMMFIRGLPNAEPSAPKAKFIKQEKAFASTAQQYFTQRVYQTSASIGFAVTLDGRRLSGALDTLTPAGAGFEYIRDQPLRDQIVALHEELMRDILLPVKPVDVGRYTTVFDASTVAQFISRSIGSATELDRALGYEANAGGTSYITEPLSMVGALKIGAPSVTITANRTEAAGAATVKWDDEGTPPDEFTLVKEGILADMQTNREGAGWFKDYYVKQNKPVVSHGCAYASEAIHLPLTHCANLQLQGGTDAAVSLESLIANERKAMLVRHGSADMDFQQSTGLGLGSVFEIRNGKRVAMLSGAGTIFRTPELWSNVIAIGGSANRQRFGIEASKGQPAQASCHSVTSAPMTVKELTMIDATRKA